MIKTMKHLVLYAASIPFLFLKSCNKDDNVRTAPHHKLKGLKKCDL